MKRQWKDLWEETEVAVAAEGRCGEKQTLSVGMGLV